MPILIDGDHRSAFELQLRQHAQVPGSHGLEVVDENADPAAIRREIATNLTAGSDFVLVNLAHGRLGQEGDGHISPLGAQDERSDSILVMDVNPDRATWVRVETRGPIAAMRAFDTVENRTTPW